MLYLLYHPLFLTPPVPPALPPRMVEDQIIAGIKPYTTGGWAPKPGGPSIVQLQLHVRRGDQVFRDELTWDLGPPANTPPSYAAAVCTDLGLDATWYDAIVEQLASRLQEVRQVGKQAGICVACGYQLEARRLAVVMPCVF